MSDKRDQSPLRAAATSLPSRTIRSDQRVRPRPCTAFSAQATLFFAWQIPHAFGEPNARVAAGEGGRIEWSVRTIRANSVFGMWQSVQRVPGPSPAWRVWTTAFFTRSSWQGRQASFGRSLNLYRPLEVWQCTQSSCPDFAQGLWRQEVRV